MIFTLKANVLIRISKYATQKRAICFRCVLIINCDGRRIPALWKSRSNVVSCPFDIASACRYITKLSVLHRIHFDSCTFVACTGSGENKTSRGLGMHSLGDSLVTFAINQQQRYVNNFYHLPAGTCKEINHRTHGGAARFNYSARSPIDWTKDFKSENSKGRGLKIMLIISQNWSRF